MSTEGIGGGLPRSARAEVGDLGCHIRYFDHPPREFRARRPELVT
jgi:hypothetical protein